MDASSLNFFQQQVASLEADLKEAQESMINELESRTKTAASADCRRPSTIQRPGSAAAATAAAAVAAARGGAAGTKDAGEDTKDDDGGWEASIAKQEANIEELTRTLAEARSTCNFIIQRERDKIHLLSSTEDSLVSCLLLMVLSSEWELPSFISEMHQWNESRGLTAVLHVFSSWCAVYVEGQKSVVSHCLAFLSGKSKLLRVLHKNGFPCGTPESEVPMSERKVPNCTLHVEWHSKEMARGGTALSGGAATASDAVTNMIDTLGRNATEVIHFAPTPTYLLSQLLYIDHDHLNPSRLVSTETHVWQEHNGRFVIAVGSHTPLDMHGATLVSAALRQRLQRAQGSCVMTPWGSGPVACLACVVNHPTRNMLEEATALPDALRDALKSAGVRGGPFSVAVAWARTDAEEFLMSNTAHASIVGWGVRKLRCMMQFAVEHKEKTVFTTSFVERLTILERQKIRLVARVTFHRTMPSDDVWAPPVDGVLSSSAKSVDEQLRNVNRVTRTLIGRRQGLQEKRGLRDVPGFDIMAAEREAMRRENDERNDIEGVFFALPSLADDETVLVSEAVHYWMSSDATGLDDVVYPKIRRLMAATGVPHTDKDARLALDKFFVITNRLRHM